MNTRLQAKVKALSAPTSSFIPERNRRLRPMHTFAGTPGRVGESATFFWERLISQSPLIQAKLTIGQPNDRYEQEADRLADEVMRMPEPSVQMKPT